MKARKTRAGSKTVVATLVTTMLVGAAAPASASSSSSYRVTGRSASTYWTQVDGTPVGGPVGNVHVGWLNADETSKGKAAVFGWIQDWDCEGDEQPGHGGHHWDEPQPEDGVWCDFVGNRSIEGFDITFTMDKKFAGARLKGQLTIYGGGHGGEVVGRPSADIVWTGVGSTSSSNYTSRYREGDTWYSETYKSTDRAATMSGILGPMGFDPDLSGGWMHTFTASSRSRTR